MSDISFTPSTYAIFRHVWTLPETHRSILDKYFIMRSDVGTLLRKIDTTTHEYKVLLPYELISYEVEFLDCSLSFLRKLQPQTKLLLSLRYNKTNRMAIALIAIPHRKEWKSIADRFREYV